MASYPPAYSEEGNYGKPVGGYPAPQPSYPGYYGKQVGGYQHGYSGNGGNPTSNGKKFLFIPNLIINNFFYLKLNE